MAPDFPRPPPATVDPAVIWTYGTRTLTAFTGTPRAQLVGADEPIYTRITGEVVRRTELTDARISNLDKLDALISSRLAAADFDARLPSDRAARIDRIPAAIDAIEGTHTPSGINVEETVVEQTLGVLFFLEGFIDLSNLASGDAVTIAEDISLVTPISYKRYASEDYSGPQALPALYIVTKPARHALRIRLNQTAGTVRAFPYAFYVRRIA